MLLICGCPQVRFGRNRPEKCTLLRAKGSNSVAYIEIEEAPYLVLRPNKAFDGGSRPINVHESNIVWTDLPGAPVTERAPRVAFLWGDPQDGRPHGTLIKLPAGFRGELWGRRRVHARCSD